MVLVCAGILVAVEKGSQSAFLFLFPAHFGHKDDFSPEIDEAVFLFGRVEEDEVQVHTVTKK